MDLMIVYVRQGELRILDQVQEFIISSGEYALIRKQPNLRMMKTELYEDISLVLQAATLQEVLSAREIPIIAMVLKGNIIKLRPHADLKSLFLSLAIYKDSNTLPINEIRRLKSLEGIYALLNNPQVFYPSLLGFKVSNQ